MGPREPEPDPSGMDKDEFLAYLHRERTVSLWPFAGRALGASRSLTYALAKSSQIQVLRLGQHRIRVSSAWLENMLFPDE